jgi:hypothetical protein
MNNSHELVLQLKQLLASSYIISLVLSCVVVLFIHPSRHPSSSSWKKKMMEEEEEKLL